jgi:hypothetical protein
MNPVFSSNLNGTKDTLPNQVSRRRPHQAQTISVCRQGPFLLISDARVFITVIDLEADTED